MAKPDIAGDASQAIVIPWAEATLDDLLHLDFEAPINAFKDGDTHDIATAYRAAIEPRADGTQASEDSKSRIFAMLAGVADMRLLAHEIYNPFQPMAVFSDGRRSAVLSDFKDNVEVLAKMAESATNSLLRARLADVVWLLDRKQGRLAALAIDAYVRSVQLTKEDTLLLDGRDYLRRALTIGRAIGWDKPETLSARTLAVELRKRALAEKELAAANALSELDLDFTLSDLVQVACDVESLIPTLPTNSSRNSVVALWHTAARAYSRAKRESDKNRCRSEAAELLVVDAEEALQKRGSAMVASHILANAIASLHGIPEKKSRRTELRHRLVDIQGLIVEEMNAFSHSMDLTSLARATEKRIGSRPLVEQLFVFASLSEPPDADQLVEDAKASIAAHPLSSLFGASHMDSEGKVIHKTASANFGDAGDVSAIQQQIAQAESIRRNVTSSGEIEVARRAISGDYYVSEETLTTLLQWSPFVPPDVLHTFGRGFARFFQGDFVSAIYILTPLLENSLRYVLKSSGFDVSTFDDATQTQQDRSISSLYDSMRPEMQKIFSQPVVEDIERVFIARPGPSIRHTLCHGLLQDNSPYGGDAVYACWLLFRLCLVPLFPHFDEIKNLL